MKTYTLNFTSSQGSVNRKIKCEFKSFRQVFGYAQKVIIKMLPYMADGEELKSSIHSDYGIEWEECTTKHPKESWQFPFVVLFALRYALSRHSCAPSIVASYISEHWDELKQQHDGILSDIKELLENHSKWQADTLYSIDYATWQNLYNELISKTEAK